MENENQETLKRIRRPDTVPIYASDAYDDGDIPPVDLPRASAKASTQGSSQNNSQDVIPDEVPRRDGPGGEGNGGQN